MHGEGACGVSMLSQQCYVETILDRHGMSSCRPIATPMVVGLKLAKLEEPEVDVWEYQSHLGTLMYAVMLHINLTSEPLTMRQSSL
jgi:hypothetical protein